QRESHDARRERGARPAESDDDPEPLLEDRADRPPPPEQEQEKEADHHGREHQGQVHRGVEQRLSGEARARQSVGDGDRKRKAHENAPERDAQAEPEDLNLFRREAHWNSKYGFSGTGARPGTPRSRIPRRTLPCWPVPFRRPRRT